MYWRWPWLLSDLIPAYEKLLKLLVLNLVNIALVVCDIYTLKLLGDILFKGFYLLQHVARVYNVLMRPNLAYTFPYMLLCKYKHLINICCVDYIAYNFKHFWNMITASGFFVLYLLFCDIYYDEISCWTHSQITPRTRTHLIFVVTCFSKFYHTHFAVWFQFSVIKVNLFPYIIPCKRLLIFCVFHESCHSWVHAYIQKLHV